MKCQAPAAANTGRKQGRARCDLARLPRRRNMPQPLRACVIARIVCLIPRYVTDEAGGPRAAITGGGDLSQAQNPGS